MDGFYLVQGNYIIGSDEQYTKTIKFIARVLREIIKRQKNILYSRFDLKDCIKEGIDKKIKTGKDVVYVKVMRFAVNVLELGDLKLKLRKGYGCIAVDDENKKPEQYIKEYQDVLRRLEIKSDLSLMEDAGIKFQQISFSRDMKLSDMIFMNKIYLEEGARLAMYTRTSLKVRDSSGKRQVIEFESSRSRIRELSILKQNLFKAIDDAILPFSKEIKPFMSQAKKIEITNKVISNLKNTKLSISIEGDFGSPTELVYDFGIIFRDIITELQSHLGDNKTMKNTVAYFDEFKSHKYPKIESSKIYVKREDIFVAC